MVHRDTVVIGASAGGVETLCGLVHDLPPDLPAAVLVVVHFPESATSVLPAILNRAGPLPAHHGKDGEKIVSGHIYVAPSGRHMLIREDRIRLTSGPRENGNRPAIDPLFRSAARERGSRVISVILSGLLEDGTLGTSVVKKHGGVTMAQDPQDALFGDMPRNAIEQVGTDYVLPLGKLTHELIRVAGTEAEQVGEPVEKLDETEMDADELQTLERSGRPSAYVCPECHGTLFELKEEGVSYYRCRVGHSYLAESLEHDQRDHVEAALWSAVRALQEHNSLLTQMLKHAEMKGYKVMTKTYRDRLEQGRVRLGVIQQVLEARHDRMAEEDAPTH